MAKASCTDQEFIELFRKHGAAETAKILGITVRNIYVRRANLEGKYGTIIGPYHQASTRLVKSEEYPARQIVKIKNGVAMISSDAHYWPGIVSTAHRGFIKLAKELKPDLLVENGDAVDGAAASRHPPNGWEEKPSQKEELQAVEERLDEKRAAAKSADFVFNMGNHDARFENFLSANASQFKGVPGFSLREHFPHWSFGMSLWINSDVVVKHRWKGGVHATHNNTLNSGKTIVTGHLHSLKVTPFTDYNGTRYGVDTGTLADPCGPQFSYDEDNAKNHRSGFIVLTFHNGKLLLPEIAQVYDRDHIQFRGKLIKV